MGSQEAGPLLRLFQNPMFLRDRSNDTGIYLFASLDGEKQCRGHTGKTDESFQRRWAVHRRKGVNRNIWARMARGTMASAGRAEILNVEPSIFLYLHRTATREPPA